MLDENSDSDNDNNRHMIMLFCSYLLEQSTGYGK